MKKNEDGRKKIMKLLSSRLTKEARVYCRIKLYTVPSDIVSFAGKFLYSIICILRSMNHSYRWVSQIKETKEKRTKINKS